MTLQNAIDNTLDLCQYILMNREEQLDMIDCLTEVNDRNHSELLINPYTGNLELQSEAGDTYIIDTDKAIRV